MATLVTAGVALATFSCAGPGGALLDGRAADDDGGALDAAGGGPVDDHGDGDAGVLPSDPAPCPAGPAGLDCLFAQWDALAGGCDAPLLAAFEESVARRHGDLPAWHAGRALFVTRGGPAAVAGTWNNWSPTALVTAQLCGGPLWVAEAPVPSGRHEYKLVRGGVYALDPENWAFAYDDFPGNGDGRNSVLNTYDSGVGHLVQPDEELCSAELGNCRPFTTYLPRGYGAPANAARRYPVVFMHDGQNIFDDHDCCFGHTGWEVNVTLDERIASGAIEEAIVVGFDHAGPDRGAEYAFAEADGGRRELFQRFQVEVVQRRAAEIWRLDGERVFVAGSSFGGLASILLAFAYPDVYAGAAALSGAFWPGQDTGHAARDVVAAIGYTGVPLYLDTGGTPEDGADGYWNTIELRDLLVAQGWRRADSPACALAPGALCFFHDVGATHDELAWRARAHRFLEFFLGPP